ncbi:MAG: alkaline phosphatase family protein [Acidimicrobiales bacterium]
MALGTLAAQVIPAPGAAGAPGHGAAPAARRTTATPIKHLVVIFQENVSFDHYFGTYPNATNPPGEPAFKAKPGTPSVNGLSGALLTANPNLSNPQLLNPSQALTCDQDHGYSAEQSAFDHGLMDAFVQNTGGGLTLAQCLSSVGNTTPATGTSPNYAVMDYFDGNTVTGLWNYAQSFAMSDNAYGTNVGPSTPGALNVTSANTYGAICGPTSAVYFPPGTTPATCPAVTANSAAPAGAPTLSQAAGPGTTYSEADPYYDICSYSLDHNTGAKTIQMGGPNIGDSLSSAGLAWGWFEGGFDGGYVPGHGKAPSTASTICGESHKNVGNATVSDYIPHHDPFQNYLSTSNPNHLPPTSVAMVGHPDQANHNYDIADFWAAAASHNMPAVSFLKAPAYQDGHAGYSDPLDEQPFLVNTINKLEKLPTWSSTAVVITYDDSDGWYDHQLGPIVRHSQTSLDSLSGAGQCGTASKAVRMANAGAPEQARCGVGPRLPFLMISPYSKTNYVDNSLVTQSSVVSFIEDNWNLVGLGGGAADTEADSLTSMLDFHGPRAPKVFLNPATGERTGRAQRG